MIAATATHARLYAVLIGEALVALVALTAWTLRRREP